MTLCVYDKRIETGEFFLWVLASIRVWFHRINISVVSRKQLISKATKIFVSDADLAGTTLTAAEYQGRVNAVYAASAMA